jgi:hypothetical protein
LVETESEGAAQIGKANTEQAAVHRRNAGAQKDPEDSDVRVCRKLSGRFGRRRGCGDLGSWSTQVICSGIIPKPQSCGP